jgi:hypothetical protein
MASADILRAARVEHTAGPWEYVPGNENHGPYVVSDFGSTICDCYVMTEPHPVWSDQKRKPVPFLQEMAEPNARLIAAAPTMLEALKALDAWWTDSFPAGPDAEDISYGFGKLSSDTLAIWRQVRAAIAAAEREAGQ